VARKVRYLSLFGQKLRSLEIGLSGQSCRKLAGAALAVQILGILAAASTHLMLHGDGAYFVFALCVGQPWLLKWAFIAARFTVYITTVVPTEWIGWGLHLSPVAIADLNGFIFYLVPTLLYVGACTLVWRRNPRYLIFPAAQYILSTSLGFGYPSEILLAPGFLWICLFLTLGDRTPNVLFFISLLALIFSHELAIPSALVAILLALQQARANDGDKSEHWRFALVAITSTSILALFVCLRLTAGGEGSDLNAIYVFDPRRIFANPTMWLMIASMVVAIALFRRFASSASGELGWWVAIPAAAIPMILKFAVPSFDFDQGRYESARTIIGVVMFSLAMAFALVRARIDQPLSTSARAANASVFVLAVAFAVSAGAGAAFVLDWTIALRGLQRVVTTTTVAEHVPKFIPFDDMLARVTPDEASALNRIDYFWALPYRSIILAGGLEPGHIVYANVDYHGYCRVADVISKERSGIPAATLDEMKNFACTYIAPPPQHLTRDKIMALVRSFITLLQSSYSRGN
jgi:hypothetical protein